MCDSLKSSGKLPSSFILADDEGALRAIFNQIDTDRGGSLDTKELESFFMKTLFKGFA